MTNLNWSQLRLLDGSQNRAFEELCCQLAAHEPAPADSEFRRIGAPDAGVECIWRDSHGVRGWQAKFFLRPPSAGEWQQIDDSVRQAMEHYPDLVAYTVCLPLDRPDARVAGQQSMMDRWNSRVAKWTAKAEAAGRIIAFHYWGEHEIVERLARQEHVGRAYFWFSAAVLGPDWFRERFRIARDNAGPRYSPELDVTVSISDLFDALARHPRFAARLRKQWGVLRRDVARSLPSRRAAATEDSKNANAGSLPTQQIEDPATRAADDRVEGAVGRVRSSMDRVAALIPDLNRRAADRLPIIELENTAKGLDEALSELAASLEAAADVVAARANAERAEEASGEPKPVPYSRGTDIRRIYEHERYAVYRAGSELEEFIGLLTDEGARLANKPMLLVVGDAGTGKTHLFCDVADRTVKDDEPCVLLLGEQFVRGDAWSQIIQQLQLDCPTPEHLLGALSAAGEATGRRSLLLIDALNEGEGRRTWRDQLPGVFATIQSYPWIAVAVSVRSSYEPLVIPDSLRAQIISVQHRGFAEREVAATRRFFDAHGIERPSVPLLMPEFSNPLFLMLFCRGIRNRGLTRVPPGLEGISAIFSFFLDSVQQRIADPDRVDFDSKIPVVERAVSALAIEMVQTGSQWIERERVASILETVLPTRGGFEHSLLRGLLSEGVLSEELLWTGPEASKEAVRFTYERFGDHRIAALLLESALTPKTPVIPTPESNLHESAAGPEEVKPLQIPSLFTDGRSQWFYRGIINALAIQVPERTTSEIWELWPEARRSSVVPDAFFESLLWRRPESIGQTAIRLAKRYVRERTVIGDRVRDLLMGTAARPNHPLNAEFLHDVLNPLPMAERDVWWSTFAAHQDGDATTLGRLIDWAWSAGGEAHHAVEAAELAGVGLAWALTTPNRRVRDHATKALVSLLQSRPKVLVRILTRFRDVDDPYVAERLYGVAYGCVLRGLPLAELEVVARETFQQVFANGTPPPHLLLRDYARGIIEAAVACGLLSDIDVARARPPYHSDPPGEVPTEAELRERYYTPFKAGQAELGYFSIWSSLLSEGDFARYIVGTNSHSFEWSSRPITEAHVPTRWQRYDRFFRALSQERRQRWYQISGAVHRLSKLVGQTIDLKRGSPITVTAELVKAFQLRREKQFRRSLPSGKRAEFDAVKDWGDEPREPNLFDLDYALRWMFQRVIELGWTPERFNWFDRHRDYESRMSHRSERIGKKYQWLAFHEFAARVADNFEFVGDRWTSEPQRYEGPWQFYRRDLDPSYLGRGGPGILADSRLAWYQPVEYQDWRRQAQDEVWIRTLDDLPRLAQLVIPRDPQTGVEWFWLRGDVEWSEPAPPEEERYEKARRELRYWITGYLVQSRDRDRLVEWATGRDLWSLRLHDSLSTQQVFIGEYPWAPAYTTQYPESISKPWTRLGDKLPVPVLHPAITLFGESSGYDNSIEESLNMAAPSPALLGTSIDTRAGRTPADAAYRNPSGLDGGPDVLLGRRSLLEDRMRARGLEIVWILTGEKILIGGPMWTDDWVGRLEISAVGSFHRDHWQERRTTFLHEKEGQRTKLE